MCGHGCDPGDCDCQATSAPAASTPPATVEPKTVYIAGPMTGYTDYNYPAFFAAEERWQAAGWTVLNPARHDTDWITPDLDADTVRAAYMKMDIEDVMRADAIALLPGWEKSTGANVELSVARVLLKHVLDADTMLPLAEESVCHEADRLVSTDRQDDYGHPLDDFEKVVGMAHALWGRGPETAGEHAIYMVLVKLSREANRHKRDNLVDICGYVKTLELVVAERARRAV